MAEVTHCYSVRSKEFDDLYRFCIERFHSVAVCDADDVPVAFMMLYPDTSGFRLYVKPEYRRARLGDFVYINTYLRMIEDGDGDILYGYLTQGDDIAKHFHARFVRETSTDGYHDLEYSAAVQAKIWAQTIHLLCGH